MEGKVTRSKQRRHELCRKCTYLGSGSSGGSSGGSGCISTALPARLPLASSWCRGWGGRGSRCRGSRSCCGCGRLGRCCNRSRLDRGGSGLWCHNGGSSGCLATGSRGGLACARTARTSRSGHGGLGGRRLGVCECTHGSGRTGTKTASQKMKMAAASPTPPRPPQDFLRASSPAARH